MLHLKASSVDVLKSAFDAQQSSSKFNWFLCSRLLSAAESSVKTCLLIFSWICHSMVCEVFTFIYLSCHTWTRLLHVEQLIFWGMWKISIHYLLLLPVLFYNTLKSCSHVFPLHYRDIFAGISREIQMEVSDVICMRFLPYQTYLTHTSPGEFWTYCANCSVKWRFSQQVLPFSWRYLQNIAGEGLKICCFMLNIWTQQHCSFSALIFFLLLYQYCCQCSNYMHSIIQRWVKNIWS